MNRPGEKYGHLDPFVRSTAENVEEFGWAATTVMPTADSSQNTASFCYTTNLEEYCGVPELIMFNQSNAHSFISFIVKNVEDGLSVEGAGEQIDGIIEDFPVELRRVHRSQISHYFTTSIVYHREMKRLELEKAIQVFWPDMDGDFPWDWEFGNHWYQPRLDLPYGQENEYGKVQ